MANYKKPNHLQRYIELLEVCNNPTVTRAIVQTAPDNVIKTICNAAINCYRGDVHLSPKHKRVLRRFKKHIEKLCSKKIGLKAKRKILVQKGGAIWIPMLLGSLLTSFGTQFFDRVLK